MRVTVKIKPDGDIFAGPDLRTGECIYEPIGPSPQSGQ